MRLIGLPRIVRERRLWRVSVAMIYEVKSNRFSNLSITQGQAKVQVFVSSKRLESRSMYLYSLGSLALSS